MTDYIILLITLIILNTIIGGIVGHKISTDKTDGVFVGGFLALASSCAIFLFSISLTAESWRSIAIEKGFAKYTVNSVTGETKFEWNETVEQKSN